MDTQQIQQEKFEGWAIVELFGHVKEAGWVSTKYFGAACFFEIRVPGLPERETQLKYPAWGTAAVPTLGGGEIIEERRLPAGAIVKRIATPDKVRLVGASAIYSLNPCSQAEVYSVVEAENRSSEKLLLVSMPAAALPAPSEPQDRTFDCCGGNPEDGHKEYCAADMDEDEG